MITVDNMILFIFITVCIIFGVGISAILRIYSRRHQQNIESEDPFRNESTQNRNQHTNQELNNRNIFVIDVGNEQFYKGPPPPKYGEEMPPSYEDVIRYNNVLQSSTTTTTINTERNIITG